jgi:biotin transport system ATP-binding protein
MIEICGVNHWFGDRPVLQDINLSLTESRIGVIGSNGSGKSTFARLLNGLLLPIEGQVLVDGFSTRRYAKQIRRRVGFVFQNPDHQIVLPTVEEDIAFGLKNLKLPVLEVLKRVDAVLTQYQLQEYRHQSAHLLSGGQKQLLAIASVLVMQPQYIVFDEPTTLLDLHNCLLIKQVLSKLSQSIIVVSHDLNLLKDFDRVIVFDQGKVVMDDQPGIAIPYYVQQQQNLWDVSSN